MDLKIKDVAELLNVSETTIRRWLSEGKIPAYRLQHQYRFSRGEIENWMMSCKINNRDEMKHEEKAVSPKGWQQFSLTRALHKGAVIFNGSATSKEELIRETTETVAQDLGLDADVLTEMLLDREAMMPTALNQGLAIPHTRDFLLKGSSDSVVLVFPTNPIDWGALDNEPVHTAFFLFACDDKHHLNLLAKIAHLSSDPESVKFLAEKPGKKELIAFVKAWESKVPANIS